MELKSNKAHIETRGTAKKEFMKRDTKITKLIEASVYRTKPIHYISMVSGELKWVVKEKECFNIDTCEVKNLYTYT